MAGKNGSETDRNGVRPNGSVEPFAVPDDRIDGSGDGFGFPTESAEPERTGSSGTGRKRGPKPGWKRTATGPTGTDKKTDRQRLPSVDILAGSLKGASALSNAAFKHFILHDPLFDEMELDDDEAEKLAGALIDLAKYYPGIDVPGVALAWMNVAQCVGAIATAHVGIYKLRKHNEAKARRPVAMPHPPVDPNAGYRI